MVNFFSQWVDQIAKLCRPAQVHICDGSEAEARHLEQLLVQAGTFVPLKRPHSFWCHSHPDDVARVEENTFICSLRKEDAGPTNNWKDPKEMHAQLHGLFSGCMEGRTMYVIPYCMGPVGSPLSRFGVEITDSPYVVLNMRLMTCIVPPMEKFVPGVHSVGMPLKPGQKDVPWPCNPLQRHIVHFPEEKAIWSFGSGYGGNALLGKKCFALRIASVVGRDEGWLAEHMLILGLTSPQGEKKYIAAAFPSGCGKTNLAMLTPALPGWKVECVGDDIAWMHFGKDGRLYAINPEAGYFGVAPGTSMKTNPNAILSLTHDAIFTNVALTEDKDVWWEGLSPPPAHLTSWLGTPWDPQSGQAAAHPNSRFTVASRQCPIYDPAAEALGGVPISAILFGGRRASVVPLVTEAFDWAHGVFFGASVSSETTAAAKGALGKLRHDPFAMLPFCGYHMGDYFAHWLKVGAHSRHLPRIYSVNWFQKGADGKFLWPGFGDNARVLKWVFERTGNNAPAKKTPIGYIPETLDYEGDLTELLKVDRDAWLAECDELTTYFQLFGDKMPPALLDQLHQLRCRLT